MRFSVDYQEKLIKIMGDYKENAEICNIFKGFDLLIVRLAFLKLIIS